MVCDLVRGSARTETQEDAMALEIVARKDGPYLVTGDLSQLELRDGDGNLYDLGKQSRMFLCRCGGSTTKPFCDGTAQQDRIPGGRGGGRGRGLSKPLSYKRPLVAYPADAHHRPKVRAGPGYHWTTRKAQVFLGALPTSAASTWRRARSGWAGNRLSPARAARRATGCSQGWDRGAGRGAGQAQGSAPQRAAQGDGPGARKRHVRTRKVTHSHGKATPAPERRHRSAQSDTVCSQSDTDGPI